MKEARCNATVTLKTGADEGLLLRCESNEHPAESDHRVTIRPPRGMGMLVTWPCIWPGEEKAKARGWPPRGPYAVNA